MFGDGLQGRDFVYVDNVTSALHLAGKTPGVVGKVFNIGNGQSTTILDLVRHLNQLLGNSLKPNFEPARTGDVRQSEADITSARRELGYEPATSFEQGLAHTLRFYQGAGA